MVARLLIGAIVAVAVVTTASATTPEPTTSVRRNTTVLRSDGTSGLRDRVSAGVVAAPWWAADASARRTGLFETLCADIARHLSQATYGGSPASEDGASGTLGVAAERLQGSLHQSLHPAHLQDSRLEAGDDWARSAAYQTLFVLAMIETRRVGFDAAQGADDGMFLPGGLRILAGAESGVAETPPLSLVPSWSGGLTSSAGYPVWLEWTDLEGGVQGAPHQESLVVVSIPVPVVLASVGLLAAVLVRRRMMKLR